MPNFKGEWGSVPLISEGEGGSSFATSKLPSYLCVESKQRDSFEKKAPFVLMEDRFTKAILMLRKKVIRILFDVTKLPSSTPSYRGVLNFPIMWHKIGSLIRVGSYKPLQSKKTRR